MSRNGPSAHGFLSDIYEGKYVFYLLVPVERLSRSISNTNVSWESKLLSLPVYIPGRCLYPISFPVLNLISKHVSRPPQNVLRSFHLAHATHKLVPPVLNAKRFDELSTTSHGAHLPSHSLLWGETRDPQSSFPPCHRTKPTPPSTLKFEMCHWLGKRQ